MAKKKKVRVDMRKNRSKPPREQGWTSDFKKHGFADEATSYEERVRAKGDLSRRRTIIQGDAAAAGESADRPTSSADCLPGRVLRVHRLISVVEGADGKHYRCAVRRLLRTLATEERNIVTTGDRVWIRRGGTGSEADGGAPEPSLPGDLDGLIERVEPRHGVLTRASRGRKHVLVANVDQVVFVVSVVEPDLKPHLIDRYLASAAQGGIRPVVCLNKADLVAPAPYQAILGLYNQLGVRAFLTSARTGVGIARLRELLADCQTVISGQSGVGKSSLLNAVQPGLGLRVREVSDVNSKGKHTTTGSELIKLDFGGWVADTPGIRQFGLWDTIPEEAEGFFAEFGPFVPLCGFPDCTHTHEERCAVKRAVDRRQVSASRYTSYLGLFHGENAR